MAKITTALFGELAILPIPAEVPITETLEFLTDVMQAFNSEEQRLQLRSRPRQSFSYTVPVQLWNMAAAFNTEAGAIRKRWAVPIWTEGQYIGNVAEEATSIVCNTEIYDLRPNSLALLYANCSNWQIVEIGGIDAEFIEVTNTLSSVSGAWLIPIRIGWVIGDINKPTNGNSAKTVVSFQIEDNLLIEPSEPLQYLGEDIYYKVPLLNGDSVLRSLSQRSDITDFSLGDISRRSPWAYSQFATPFRSIIEGAEEMREYKNFLYRRAGKFRSFYTPTFENNLQVLNSGNIASILLVKSDSFIDYAGVRSKIAIQTIDGNWLARNISNPVQIDQNRIQLTLSSALNVPASTIARVSYLGLNRLATDRIEISWLGNNVAESEVQILELKR